MKKRSTASDAELDQILFTYSTNTSKARQEIKAALLQWHTQALQAAKLKGASEQAARDLKVMENTSDNWEKVARATQKAYGGCRLCYGKGYATVNSRWHGGFVNGGNPNAMKFCTCDRGKQLKLQVKAAELRARIDEQSRTFRLKYRSGDGDLQFAQHDGSTNISQSDRIADLNAQLGDSNG